MHGLPNTVVEKKKKKKKKKKNNTQQTICMEFQIQLCGKRIDKYYQYFVCWIGRGSTRSHSFVSSDMSSSELSLFTYGVSKTPHKRHMLCVPTNEKKWYFICTRKHMLWVPVVAPQWGAYNDYPQHTCFRGEREKKVVWILLLPGSWV